MLPFCVMLLSHSYQQCSVITQNGKILLSLWIWAWKIVLICYFSTDKIWCIHVPIQLWPHFQICVFLRHILIHCSMVLAIFICGDTEMNLIKISFKLTCLYFYIWICVNILYVFTKGLKNQELYIHISYSQP